MRDFVLEVKVPRGTLAVGGWSPAPDGLDGAHAADADGLPLIPSSALRGALRETLEGLLRGAGLPACSGGDGHDPARGPGGDERECDLDDGAPCAACRLFGGRFARLGAGRRAFSQLILGPARCASGHPADWSVRHGVSIERRRRSAAEGRLFNLSTPSPGRHLSFRAEGRLTEDDEQARRLLEAAARTVTHVGAGRSRGLARIEAELRWTEASAAELLELRPGPVGIRLHLETPACIGVPLPDGQVRDTRREIPGSTLRGSIGFALAESLEDPDHDEEFQALVAEDGGASFPFLYPADASAPEVGLAAPWPLTARACKRHGAGHGVRDTLLDRLAAALAPDARAAGRVDELSAERRGCPRCEAPLRPLRGPRGGAEAPATRTVTRVALDRRTLAARERALFSQVLLEEGSAFEGVVQSVPEASIGRLAQALSLPLSVGRGRSMGWGRVRVEVLPVAAPPRLEARAKDFAREAARRFEACGLDTAIVDRLVPLTLLSPLLPEDGDGRTELSAQLEAVSWPLVVRRFGVERGWDQRKGARPAVRSTVAGSVFVALLPEGSSAAQWLDRLASIEDKGLGQRRAMGHGRVIAFDPFIIQGES